MAQLDRLHYHVSTDGEVGEGTRARSATSFRGPARRGLAPPPAFNSDEDAARFYLDQLIERDERPTVRSISSPERPEMVPDLRHVVTQDVQRTRTRLVRFQQTDRDVPIYGAELVVELDRRRSLVSAGGRVGRPRSLSRVESLSRRQALARIEAETGQKIDPEGLPPAELVFFKDEEEPREDRAWHLAWFFREVPAALPSVLAEERSGPGLGLRGTSLRAINGDTNYLIDAHDGAILHHYSATPTVTTPTYCWGVDEDGANRQFFGNIVSNGFEMRDGTRHIVTYDLDYSDLAASRDLPSAPVSGATANWQDTARAAVSAHLNASRVHDFYNSVLQRNGIDGKGMDLVSVVKCRNVDPKYPEPYPGWVNAEWYKRKMWYGQIVNGGGVVSLSRELDIIGHELTHGVIETTAGLEYSDQSGALNESYADVFGMIIRNWYLAPSRQDRDTWEWAIGPGFGDGGGPLRDLRAPGSRQQPDHTSKYQKLPNDGGGVHFNSGIPNKAAYNLLTARDVNGFVFSVEDAAWLFYLALQRLTTRASFVDARDATADAAGTLFAGDAAERDRNVAAIRDAYARVGIG